MKEFELNDCYYELIKTLNDDEKGKLLTVLCEYYFDSRQSFGVNEKIINVANVIINYNNKIINTKQYHSSTIRQFGEDVKVYLRTRKYSRILKDCNRNDSYYETIVNETERDLPYIPKYIIKSTIDWIVDSKPSE